MKFSSRKTHYYHHYEYRHILREGAYDQWRQAKRRLTAKQWLTRYKAIFDAFVAVKLAPGGFSLTHTAIIDKILKLNGEAIRAYHPSEDIPPPGVKSVPLKLTTKQARTVLRALAHLANKMPDSEGKQYLLTVYRSVSQQTLGKL